MDAPSTVTEALELLASRGYVDDFSLGQRHIACAACGHEHPPRQLVVRETFRFEGDTDPGDEAIVLAVECEACGAKGVIVSAYGPDAEPALLDLLAPPAA